jgi:hypothetical protein
MTKDEALKLALEALEFDGFTPEDLTHRSIHTKAITAIKQALTAPVHPVARIESVNDTDSAYAYADGWNACVEHHKYIAKNAQQKDQ